MTKYRIAIQKVDGGYKHIHNVMLESENEQEVIEKIRQALKPEIEERTQLAVAWANGRENTIKKIIRETDDDLIDWNAKGKDISKEEYLENEIHHTRKEL